MGAAVRCTVRRRGTCARRRPPPRGGQGARPGGRRGAPPTATRAQGVGNVPDRCGRPGTARSPVAAVGTRADSALLRGQAVLWPCRALGAEHVHLLFERVADARGWRSSAADGATVHTRSASPDGGGRSVPAQLRASVTSSSSPSTRLPLCHLGRRRPRASRAASACARQWPRRRLGDRRCTRGRSEIRGRGPHGRETPFAIAEDCAAATLESTARPTAPPTCCAVPSRADASPECSARTVPVATVLTETKTAPMPRAVTTNPGNRSRE